MRLIVDGFPPAENAENRFASRKERPLGCARGDETFPSSRAQPRESKRDARVGDSTVSAYGSVVATPVPARSSSEVEKKAGGEAWKLNSSKRLGAEVPERSRRAEGAARLGS